MDDLKIIKKKYGEKMMHLCKKIFPTILETEGLLSSLMLKKFDPSHFLYEDIMNNDLESEFKNYVYGLVDNNKNGTYQIIDRTPEELLSDAGYNLYECNSEEEIQKFKKYYKEDEALCTFNGSRLDRCYVFFAVKKNVDQILRENFQEPDRQDLYGTSVLSIQFTKDDYNTLSIKNRYNHKVNNPDATFSNNLDNIIPGLTESFQKEYGLLDKVSKTNFEIPGYVRANDGKYYKYNFEINNIYYCVNNKIINNFEVADLEKEKYVVMDNYVLDIQNKKIKTLGNDSKDDAFIDSVGDIDKINIVNDQDFKKTIINNPNGESIEITLNKLGKIVGYKNNYINQIKDDFLKENDSLVYIRLDNAKEIGNNFLEKNQLIEKLSLPSCEVVGDNFLYSNVILNDIYMPKCQKIKNNYLVHNQGLKSLSLESVTQIKNNFLIMNEDLEYLNLNNCKSVGESCLNQNDKLEEIEMNECIEIKGNFLSNNSRIRKADFLSCKRVGTYFLNNAMRLENLNMPRIQEIGNYSLTDSKFVNLTPSEIRSQSKDYHKEVKSII